MIIEKKINLKRYPYTDPKTKQIVYPDPLILDNIEISFEDRPKQKMILAKIENIPLPLVLYHGKDYDNLGDWTKKQLEEKITALLGDNPEAVLQKYFPKTLESHPNGPGTQLSNMLSSIGITSSPTCSCKQRAIIMNENGPEWCENNMDTIIGWLKEEATKRKLPFVETVARLMVKRAISKSKRLLKQQNNGQ